jgi:transcription termination factor Rho
MLLQAMANRVTATHPEAWLMVLLVKACPEEVTAMQRSVRGEVISSTVDEPGQRHIQVEAKTILRHGAQHRGSNQVNECPAATPPGSFVGCWRGATAAAG